MAFETFRTTEFGNFVIGSREDTGNLSLVEKEILLTIDTLSTETAGPGVTLGQIIAQAEIDFGATGQQFNRRVRKTVRGLIAKKLVISERISTRPSGSASFSEDVDHLGPRFEENVFLEGRLFESMDTHFPLREEFDISEFEDVEVGPIRGRRLN